MIQMMLWVATATAQQETNTVITTEGPVIGRLTDRVVAFKGIPYAEPPVGELRWKAPQRKEAWKEPRDCFDYGPAAPQNQATNSVRQAGPERQSEDCLYLNVWAPEGGKNRPIMVWIHGGGHQQGAGSLPIYDGTPFAKQGVVLVTINYRLGIFGFLAHPELTKEAGASGNYGYLDQVAALEWVQRNGAKFGGDPKNVTIFGQSAGAVSCAALMASPMTKGLFHRAALHSGGATRTMQTLSEAEARGSDLIGRTGARRLRDMRSLPTDRLLELTPAEALGPGRGAKDWPCVDGKFLPKPVGEVWENGAMARVPLMVGSTADEGTTFGRSPAARMMTPERFENQLRSVFGPRAARAGEVYPHATTEAARESYVQAMTDSFIGTVRRAGLAMAKTRQPVYQWHFTRATPFYERSGLGAFHGAELSYVFGNMGAPFFRSEDRELSDRMVAAWARFAESGNPNGRGLIDWPRFDARREATLVWDLQPRIENGIRLDAMKLIDR